MSATPLKKDNSFLYDSVNLFEQGDRALSHNQFGAHIYTPELDSLFGAKKVSLCLTTQTYLPHTTKTLKLGEKHRNMLLTKYGIVTLATK